MRNDAACAISGHVTHTSYRSRSSSFFLSFASPSSSLSPIQLLGSVLSGPSRAENHATTAVSLFKQNVRENNIENSPRAHYKNELSMKNWMFNDLISTRPTFMMCSGHLTGCSFKSHLLIITITACRKVAVCRKIGRNILLHLLFPYAHPIHSLSAFYLPHSIKYPLLLWYLSVNLLTFFHCQLSLLYLFMKNYRTIRVQI